MKQALALVMFGLCVHASPAWSAPVKVLVDGKEMPMSPPAMLRDGRVFIPVTAFRKIGLAVEVTRNRKAWVGWPESDNIVDFEAGVRKYAVDGGRTRTLPVAPFLYQGTLMVPLRALLSDKDNGTNLVAEWNAASRTVRVNRSRHWLRWRLEQETELIKARPNCYSHVWLGEYVPATLRK